MIKEYLRFFKNYFKLVDLKYIYLFINILTAFFYKLFMLLLPLVGSLIIKYVTDGNSIMSYTYIGVFTICYVIYILALAANYRIYFYNMSYCYNQLTDKIFNKLLTVDNNFTKKISKGKLASSVNSDIIEVGSMNDFITETLMGSLQVIIVLIIVANVNIYLSIILVGFAIIYIVVRNAADRYINIYHNKVKMVNDRYSNLLNNSLSGLEEIKTFNMYERFGSRLNNIQTKFKKNYQAKMYYTAIRDSDSKIIFYLFKFLLYAILIFLLANESIEISILVLIISYQEYLLTYIDTLITATSTVRQVNTAVSRLSDIMNYTSPDIEFGNKSIDKINALSFDKVSLSIKGNDILKDVSLNIEDNEVIAIVGEKGAGKTMLFNLILRLNKPSSGTISINGENVKNYDRKTYYDLIAVVNKYPFVFNTSIRHNLNLVDKNVSKQVEVCKFVGIHETIINLPNGYKTLIKEHDSIISSSEKQLLSLARAILSCPDIILLDDITTSLDYEVVEKLPKIIKKLKQEYTLMMITNNKDLIDTADRIIVMKNGKIENEGDKDYLLKNSKTFSNIYNRKIEKGDDND